MNNDTAQICQQIDLLTKQIDIVRIQYQEIKKLVEKQFLGNCEFAYNVVPIQFTPLETYSTDMDGLFSDEVEDGGYNGPPIFDEEIIDTITEVGYDEPPTFDEEIGGYDGPSIFDMECDNTILTVHYEKTSKFDEGGQEEYDVTIVADGKLQAASDSCEFWGMFEGFAPIENKVATEDDIILEKTPLQIYSIFDGKVKGVDGVFSKSNLENNKCYLLGCDDDFFVWVDRLGKQMPPPRPPPILPPLVGRESSSRSPGDPLQQHMYWELSRVVKPPIEKIPSDSPRGHVRGLHIDDTMDR
ncbi:hypothetical protein DH2020_039183 [Rehmannia glutinosa]|uniref:Uncharacterized protein n=1 Tax=Rehmannia glutinosa TaxID=99300 RepID=A0ABR0UX05_REHGL